MLTISAKVSKSKRGKRILLVDDEPDVTMLFSMVLNARNGFDVHSFNDPLLALSNFKPDYHNLAILEIKMPKMNGFEKQEDMTKEMTKEYCTLNKDMFLQKPISNKDLLLEINKRIRE